jgi:hypothetical protein
MRLSAIVLCACLFSGCAASPETNRAMNSIFDAMKSAPAAPRPVICSSSSQRVGSQTYTDTFCQ